jgi:hypothetical protein
LIVVLLAANAFTAASAQTFTAQGWSSGLAPSIPITDLCATGDFNGDSRIDLICYQGGTSGVWSVALSTGTVFAPQTWATGIAPGTPITNQCMTGDFNGDGMTDMACYTGVSGTWPASIHRAGDPYDRECETLSLCHWR